MKTTLTFGFKTALKTSIPAVAFVVTLTTVSIAKAASFIPSDIVWLLDTSGSMGNDINEVKSRIGEFDRAMIDSGIDAHYALVRFGGRETLIQDLTDFSTFTAPGSPFNRLTDNGGSKERGSRAINVALARTTFRPGSVKNFILVTDEDDDSSFSNFQAASLGLTETDTLFNFIGVPGRGNTDSYYGNLAANHGGVGFNIDQFRAHPEPFFDNFVDTKVREIQERYEERQSTAEPVSILGILLAGISGIFLPKNQQKKLT